MTLLFIQSILVYSALAFSMFLLAKNYSIRSKCGRIAIKSLFPWEYWCIILLFAIVAGLRWDVGVDHLSYLDIYLRQSAAGSTYDHIELGFKGLILLFNKLGLHYFFFFAFCAAVQMFFILLAFRKSTSLIPYIVLLIVLGSYFLNWMNGIRQCMVACSFVWAASFIKTKKVIYYLLWCLVCFFFHRSSLLLLPFIFFAFSDKIWKNRIIIYVILLVSIIIGSAPVWTSYLNSLAFIPELLGYDNYASDLTSILSGDDFRLMSWGPTKIGILLTNIIVIWFYNKTRRLFKYSCIDLFYKFSVIGAVFYYLFCNTSHILLRPSEYFTIFLLPMTAYTLVGLKRERRYIPYMLLTGISMSYTFICCLKAFLLINSTPSTLFQFFFNH